MALLPTEFVHPLHMPYFIAATTRFQCHILVRKTGLASISWIGRPGYTGKLMDMKAKTSDLDAPPRYSTAGLVCSPELQPGAFSGDRLEDARKEWPKSAHLVTVPANQAGFADDRPPANCRTPYILQNNPNHKHFGCVAFTEQGTLKPQYVHGDYDLYDILPAKTGIFPSLATAQRAQSGIAPANAKWAVGIPRRGVTSLESPLLSWVADYINDAIAAATKDATGARMVNHGEEMNRGKEDAGLQPVLAFIYHPSVAESFRILATHNDHARFYREVGLPA